MSDESKKQTPEERASLSKTDAFVASSGFAIYELEFGIVEKKRVEKKGVPRNKFASNSYTEVVVCRVKEAGPKDILDPQSNDTIPNPDGSTKVAENLSATFAATKKSHMK